MTAAGSAQRKWARGLGRKRFNNDCIEQLLYEMQSIPSIRGVESLAVVCQTVPHVNTSKGKPAQEYRRHRTRKAYFDAMNGIHEN